MPLLSAVLFYSCAICCADAFQWQLQERPVSSAPQSAEEDDIAVPEQDLVTLPHSLAHANADEEQRTLSRMKYWTPRSQPLPVNERYVLFTPDAGGPNNVRIGWEMTGLVAQATGRTLVLPPPAQMFFLDLGPTNARRPDEVPQGSTYTKVEDLINLDQLKGYLPTLTWDEFENMTGLSWESAIGQSAAVAEEDMCTFSAYKAVPNDILFLTGDKPRREGFSCGEWWLRGGPKASMKGDITRDGWSLLTHGFVWHHDAFEIASKAVSFLGIFKYSALHARYGDFQYTGDQADPEAIMSKMKEYFALGNKLYVASDSPEKIRSLISMEDIPIVTFDDLLQGVLKEVKDLYTPERWFKMLGIVEELICTFAKVFVGTGHSSFSGHIQRMRLHAQAPVTRMLIQGLDIEGLYDNASLVDIETDIVAWDDSQKLHRVIRNVPNDGDEFYRHYRNATI